MSGEMPAAMTGYAVGSQIAGYRLEEQIGRGGMAVVFRALDERLNRQVALKILAPALAADDAFRQRFIGESRAAAAVDDPHIIPVFEAGEAGGVLFIAMRYVRGGDVRSMVRDHGPLPLLRAAALISPVASALDAAHAAGLVHRDVKPANMLIDSRPGRPDHVYLSDFGLSKASLAVGGITGTGQFLGTPNYSAPEQINGKPLDGRADEYALACSAFEILTGSPPFQRNDAMAMIYAQMSEPPPPISRKRPDMPTAADSVLARGLAKQPGERYGSCREFADALREAMSLPRYDTDPGSPPTPPERPRVSVSAPRMPPGPPPGSVTPALAETEAPAEPVRPAGQDATPAPAPWPAAQQVAGQQVPGQQVPGQQVPGQGSGQQVPGQGSGQQTPASPVGVGWQPTEAAPQLPWRPDQQSGPQGQPGGQAAAANWAPQQAGQQARGEQQAPPGQTYPWAQQQQPAWTPQQQVPGWVAGAPRPALPARASGPLLASGLVALLGAAALLAACLLPFVRYTNPSVSYSIFYKGHGYDVLWYALEPTAMLLAAITGGIILLTGRSGGHRALVAATSAAMLAVGLQAVLLFAGYQFPHFGTNAHPGSAGFVGMLGGVILLSAGVAGLTGSARAAAAARGIAAAGQPASGQPGSGYSAGRAVPGMLLAFAGAAAILAGCLLPWYTYAPSGSASTSYSLFREGQGVSVLWTVEEPIVIMIVAVSLGLALIAVRKAGLAAAVGPALMAFGTLTALLFAGYAFTKLTGPAHHDVAGPVGLLGGLLVLIAGMLSYPRLSGRRQTPT